LPGQGEINKIKNQLLIQAWAQDYHIEVLHGNLSLSEQSRIIENNSYEKNIILSTNIAESSITIQNLNTVIDSGLIKISDYDFKTSTQELNLRKISLASAEQRQGRAHRQGPGTVYKLWMPMD
jgi:ATP-dependent helicase HrpB